MKIFIGNDHAGVEMKNKIKEHLEAKNIEVIDCGTDNSSCSVDYPDYAKKVAENTVKENTYGIVICGSGIGISIAANKVKGARAALCYEDQAAVLARMHNNANILALGARFIANEKALRLVDIFLETDFEERHQKRIDKLEC